MPKSKNEIKWMVEKTETGFSAYAQNQSMATTALTIIDLMEQAYEATQLFFEEEHIKVKKSDLKFAFDFQQFFEYYNVVNASFLAKRIGMNSTLLSQYVNGHKVPSEKQTNKIIMGIHQIGQELADVSLLLNK